MRNSGLDKEMLLNDLFAEQIRVTPLLTLKVWNPSFFGIKLVATAVRFATYRFLSFKIPKKIKRV